MVFTGILNRFRSIRHFDSYLRQTNTRNEFYKSIRRGDSIASIKRSILKNNYSVTDATIKKYVYTHYSQSTINRFNNNRVSRGYSPLFATPGSISRLFGHRDTKVLISAKRKNGDLFTFEKWVSQSDGATFQELQQDLLEFYSESNSDTDTDPEILDISVVV